MSSITVALVSFAIALCLGWVLSKAYFRTHGAHKFISGKKYEGMRKRYRKRLLVMHKIVMRHEDTQKQIKEMLKEIQKARHSRNPSDDNTALADDTQGELSVLLNRISERDREIADLQAKVEPSELKPEAEIAAASSDTLAQTENVRAELDAARDELSMREGQAQELHRNLAESETLCLELRAKLDSWKHRVSPLTEKLKQQRATIRELSSDSMEQN